MIIIVRPLQHITDISYVYTVTLWKSFGIFNSDENSCQNILLYILLSLISWKRYEKPQRTKLQISFFFLSVAILDIALVWIVLNNFSFLGLHINLWNMDCRQMLKTWGKDWFTNQFFYFFTDFEFFGMLIVEFFKNRNTSHNNLNWKIGCHCLFIWIMAHRA